VRAVLRRLREEEIFKEPPIKSNFSAQCEVFKDGQEFIISKEKYIVKPEGFCPDAWDSLFWQVLALRSNADFLE
jgi:uncharacterized repeat protein (TIGR04076 family)